MGGSAHCWKCNCKHPRPVGHKCHRIEAASHQIPVIPVLPGQNVPLFPDPVVTTQPLHIGLNLPVVSTQTTGAYTRQSWSATQPRVSMEYGAYGGYGGANFSFPGHAPRVSEHFDMNPLPAAAGQQQMYAQSAGNSRATHTSRGRTRQLSSPPRSPTLDLDMITNAIATAVSESLAPVNSRLAALESKDVETMELATEEKCGGSRRRDSQRNQATGPCSSGTRRYASLRHGYIGGRRHLKATRHHKKSLWRARKEVRKSQLKVADI